MCKRVEIIGLPGVLLHVSQECIRQLNENAIPTKRAKCVPINNQWQEKKLY